MVELATIPVHTGDRVEIKAPNFVSVVFRIEGLSGSPLVLNKRASTYAGCSHTYPPRWWLDQEARKKQHKTDLAAARAESARHKCPTCGK